MDTEEINSCLQCQSPTTPVGGDALYGKATEIASSISIYYDSLSEQELKENQLWGAFAESQFRDLGNATDAD